MPGRCTTVVIQSGAIDGVGTPRSRADGPLFETVGGGRIRLDVWDV